MDLRQAIARSFGPPPRTWREYPPQLVGVLITAVVCLGFLALVANDVPWTLLLSIFAAYLVYFTLLTAWRVHRAMQREQSRTGPRE